MNRQLSALIRRKYWLVVIVVCALCLMTLNIPASKTRKRTSVEQLYAQLNIDNLPFKIISPTEEKKPEPKQHIAFLKVHKTGSSTAQNLFLRFGWRRNLTFVLPPAKNKFHYPNIISLNEAMTVNNTLPPPPGRHYELLCNHVVYERKTFRSYMPNDTFYIGILREPFEMFKSALNYLRPGYIFKIKADKPATEFLKDPLKYEPKSVVRSLTNNRMSMEFGCSEETIKTKKPELILDFIKQVDQDFGLVIIAEHFEESVVLMRRYLKWSTKDIIYIDKNVAVKKNETALVGPYDRQMYKRFATVDYALYENFYRRLREQIRDEGLDFDDELLHFKEVRKMVSEFCRQKKMNPGTKLIVENSKWSDKFEVVKSDCDLIKKPEIQFVQDIREKMYGSRDI